MAQQYYPVFLLIGGSLPHHCCR